MSSNPISVTWLLLMKSSLDLTVLRLYFFIVPNTKVGIWDKHDFKQLTANLIKMNVCNCLCLFLCIMKYQHCFCSVVGNTGTYGL